MSDDKNRDERKPCPGNGDCCNRPPFDRTMFPCDPVVVAVVAKLRSRSAAGLSKYGVGLDRGDLALVDWLKHLQEELLDAAGYIEAAIVKIKAGA